MLVGYEFGGFDNRFGVLLLGVMPSCDAHRVSGTAVQRGLPPIAPDCCRAVPGHAANCYNLSSEEQIFYASCNGFKIDAICYRRSGTGAYLFCAGGKHEFVYRVPLGCSDA